MKYLNKHNNHLTMSQMTGAKRRIESLLSLIGKVDSLSGLIEVHKEIAKEGLLTYDIDIHPASTTGMFRGNSINNLNKWNVFFGLGDDGYFSRSMGDILNSGSLELYEAAVTQYKQVLQDALNEISSSLEKSFRQAAEEAEKVLAEQDSRKNESLLRGAVRFAAKAFNIESVRTVYPLDPDFLEKNDRQKVKEYLSSVRYPSGAIPGLLSGGFDMALLKNLSSIDNNTVEFKHISPKELIARYESEYRGIVKNIAGRTSPDDNTLLFKNVLPVQHSNGKLYRGYNQVILRLAMEAENLSVPVVLSSDMISSMDLDKTGPGIPLMFTNQEGEMFSQRVWFLENTDFKDCNPSLFEGIRQEFERKNTDKRLACMSADQSHVAQVRERLDKGCLANGIRGLARDILVGEYTESGCLFSHFEMDSEEYEMVSEQDVTSIMETMSGENLPWNSVFRLSTDEASFIFRACSDLDFEESEGVDLSTVAPALEKDNNEEESVQMEVGEEEEESNEDYSF